MHRTPASLLQRLRDAPDPASWARLVDLYTPLLYSWTRRLGALPQDAPDLVQEVLTVLVQKLPEFQYDQKQRFRGWLWTITCNKWRDLCRRRGASPVEMANGALPEVTAPDNADALAEAEYRQYLVVRAFKLMRAEFQTTTWQACWEHVVADRPATEVAKELGITVNAVYLAKSRVLSRLRQEMAGLLD